MAAAAKRESAARLLELLNRDSAAARQVQTIQRDIRRACGEDARCADVELGRWIERERGELARYLLTLVTERVGILQLRPCEGCGRWMCARRNDQRACSALCRHKLYEQKPDTKERRNAYMRWYFGWKDVPEQKRPTFEQWLQHNQPTRQQWEHTRKGRKTL